MVFHEEMAAPQNGNLAGPLRLEKIEKMSSTLVNRFVVLEYKKLGYQREHCKVAFFNEQGKFVAYYELTSKQFYEPFVDKYVHEARGFNSAGGSNHSTAEIGIRNCDGKNWALWDQSLEWGWQDGFMGDVASPNYDLFDSFFGEFSPTEVSFVLMHALSEDTRVIFQYVETVFDCFNQEFEWDEVDDFLLEWKERLAALSYQFHEDLPKPRFEVGTHVLCHYQGQGLSQDRWLPGCVVKHWYRQPHDGSSVPYRVQLDPDSHFGRQISVRADTDSEIRQLQRPQLRFPIGTNVKCMVNQTEWRTGRVVELWCSTKRVGSSSYRFAMAPYKVKLDDGPDFYAPVDRDSVIKLSNPEKASNINDSASNLRKEKKQKKKRKRGDEISADETDKKQKKKKENKKDNPDAPKRPLKPFESWSKLNRERVKLANPNVHEDDLENFLRSIWNQLLNEEKKPFEDNYKEEREWYKKEKASFKLKQKL